MLLGMTVASAVPLLAFAPSASSWPSQVARPAPATCPRGQTLVAPTSGWTDALGVTRLSYASAPGLVAKVPPHGITAARLTPAVLSDLGIPSGSPPGSRPGRRLVQRVLNLSENRTAPEFCRSAATRDRLVAAAPAGRRASSGSGVHFDHRFSGNWGGYEVTEAENGGTGINGAVGSWTVGGSQTSSQPSNSATWVGLGGGGGEGNPNVWGLIQDGIALQTNEGYRSWFEYVGSGCDPQTTCAPQYTAINSARPGDFVTGQVWWSTTTEACFYFSDQTRGSASFFTCQSSIPIPYDHTSAEWVNEAQPLNLFYYDNPGTISWSGQEMANTADGPYRSPFTGTFQGVIMAPFGGTPAASCSNGQVLAYPVNAANASGGGTSQIISCSIPGVDYP